MRITTLTYRRLVSHRSEYGHDALEATAAIDDGQDPNACAAELITFVQQRLGILSDSETVDRRRERLQREVERLTAEREEIKSAIEAGDKLLSEYGELQQLARDNGLGALANRIASETSEIPF